MLEMELMANVSKRKSGLLDRKTLRPPARAARPGMHELAIMQDIVDTVCKVAGEAQVSRVLLEIGSMSGLAADSLRFCFDLCTKATMLEGALLEIHDVTARARCCECNAEFLMENAIVFCVCGSAKVEILAGNELRIKEVELQNV
jgi:hydrogenase nickel incorporation protein HypA/HybF